MFRLARVSGWLRTCLSPRAVLRALAALDDTPHRIALGGAIGMFFGLTPTVGIQMALVLMVAPLIRFNRLAALMAVYVSNPVTALPIYYFNYRIGTLFFEDDWTYDQFIAVFSRRWTEALCAIWMEIGLPLLTGSLIVAVIGGLLTYPGLLWLLRALRQPRPVDASPVTEHSLTGPYTPS